MQIEVMILIGLITVSIAIAAFFIGRMKDAEDRGALRQKVENLEVRADKNDAKMDKVLEKLDTIGSSLSKLVTSHNIMTKEGNCIIGD